MAAAQKPAAALAALVFAALCLQHASAQAATGAAPSFDGLWRLTLGPQIGTVAVIGTAPGRYVLITGASSSAPPRQQVASQYAIAFARDGNPDIIDVFSVFGNYTVQLPANSLAIGAVAAVLRYDNLTAPFANLTRLNGKVPLTSPSFDGYYAATDGSRQTCLRSLHANGAYACVRNRALANGSVVSQWALLVQRRTQPLVADAFTNTGDQTYTLSVNRAALTVATVPVNGSRATLVASLTRKALPLEGSAPPLTGVFRSNPSAQFMVCGTPASARAAALCVGSSTLPGRPMVVFNVVEVQQPSGLTTEQLTSLGFFTSRWSDAAGTAKLQFFPGVQQVVAVGYRTTDIRTLVNTWTINGVPVQCEGTFLAVNCIGALNVNNSTASTISMIASGGGFGVYTIDYVMTTGSKVASYKGPLTVSVDGLTFTPALPAAA